MTLISTGLPSLRRSSGPGTVPLVSGRPDNLVRCDFQRERSNPDQGDRRRAKLPAHSERCLCNGCQTDAASAPNNRRRRDKGAPG